MLYLIVEVTRTVAMSMILIVIINAFTFATRVRPYGILMLDRVSMNDQVCNCLDICFISKIITRQKNFLNIICLYFLRPRYTALNKRNSVFCFLVTCNVNGDCPAGEICTNGGTPTSVCGMYLFGHI